MVDFIRISTRHSKKDLVEIFPKFIVGKSKDLMIRGGDFYAIWLEDRGVWSKDEQDAINLIDRELDKYAKEYQAKLGINVDVKYMWDSDSRIIDNWHKYCQKQLRDNYHPLDETLVFANQEIKKDDYATKRLPYSLEEGEIDAYDELMTALYYPEDRHKIEWAIGAIITGASKTLQKFIVLYGGPGTGKSTILNIIQQLFEGYYSPFDAKALGSSSDTFALESFKNNPLVAIQHDGDLSRLEDNTRLNSLVSHEMMTVNEKHKSLYSTKFISFLLMGTNKPVKITDAKSGILRRLIDVKPTGKKIQLSTYNRLMKKISFELGHIANHCKNIFENDPEFYNNYIPTDMMGESNDFFNFMEDSYLLFKRENKTTLKEAWEMYKTYCDQAKVPYPFPMRLVKSELKTYFDHYSENFQDPDNNQHIRNLYYGFRYQLFESHSKEADEHRILQYKTTIAPTIEFKKQKSFFDEVCVDCLAQYATSTETPGRKWENVDSVLKDIDTSKLHYVKPIENLIVIDFDIKGPDGKKSFEKNLEEASKWPKTYAELSKSGAGIHLHYIYDGDVSTLSRIYDNEVEIKVFTGNASLRRKLTKCNSEKISTISSGLPLKGNINKVENIEIIKSEKILRTLIKRNLNKEYHGATKPSMDFIYKILEDAYSSGMKYDVSDLYNTILAFAAGSTNQSEYCLNLMPKMHFKSDEISDSFDDSSKPIIILDMEVFSNVNFLNWKLLGKDKPIVRLINPTPQDIENLLQYRIIGFNNRRYDNHIMYGILIGKSIEEIYKLSKNIINGNKSAYFGEAYNLSYADIYDYSSTKQSLSKWEIELGIIHLELGLNWDEPVPEELWPKVSAYCDNDVISQEAVFEATQEDFKAREILAELAGMSINDTTNSLTTRIIFGFEKNPELVYTDLSVEFPEYTFVKEYDELSGKYNKRNMYRGIDVGFGGYVYSEPGMYENVALLDIVSLHPTTISKLNVFGQYTQNYNNLVNARVHIKHEQYDKLSTLFDGKLNKYLTDTSEAKKLSHALKIAINSVYGLTSAKFMNPFRDPRNENNIVALRGALFMKTLQDAVIEKGYQVIHVKTDSIKIPNADQYIIKFCMDFAKEYGYEFEHESVFNRICLVNDAVYIAKYMDPETCYTIYGYIPSECIENGNKWTATGTQFQVPYVFKKCFSKEPIVFKDMCEIKEVKTAMYLDFNEPLLEADNDRRFIGKVGLFTPIKPGMGGAELVKEVTKKDGKISYDYVTGTKGYRWLESENVINIMEDAIDYSYYDELVNDAIDTIGKYTDYYWFAEG